jgi:hypothetical protein
MFNLSVYKGRAKLNYTYTTNTDQCGGYTLALGDTPDTLYGVNIHPRCCADGYWVKLS